MVVENSVVTSILLKNASKTNFELNELFPDISVKRFSANRIQLEKKGLLDKLSSNEINQVYKKVNTSNDDNKQEAIKIIKDNLTLSSKDLYKIFPYISHQKFTWARWDIFPEERQQAILENSLKVNNKKKNTFKEKKNKKNEVRDIVAEYLKDVKGKVMLLPHIQCLCIQVINKLNNTLSYVGVDNSKNVIKGMKASKYLLNLDMDIILGDLENVIQKFGENEFIAMNLDYCGLMPTQAPSFKYAIDNNLIKVGGYLFLTFQKNARYVKHGYGILFNEFAKLNDKKVTGLSNSEFANDKLLEHLKTDKFEIVKKHTYQSGVPMIFYALQRVK